MCLFYPFGVYYKFVIRRFGLEDLNSLKMFIFFLYTRRQSRHWLILLILSYFLVRRKHIKNIQTTSRWQKCLSLSLCGRLESGVYLQARHCGGLVGERDSGYDSLRRRMSVWDRLTQTHPAWLLLGVSEEEANRILLKQPPGVRRSCPGMQMLTCLLWMSFQTFNFAVQVFLVRKSVALQRKVLSVRLQEDQESGTPISHFPVRESQYSKWHVWLPLTKSTFR